MKPIKTIKEIVATHGAFALVSLHLPPPQQAKEFNSGDLDYLITRADKNGVDVIVYSGKTRLDIKYVEYKKLPKDILDEVAHQAKRFACLCEDDEVSYYNDN